MTAASRISTLWKSLLQLGLRQTGLYAVYKFNLINGYYRLTAKRRYPPLPAADLSLHPVLSLPDRTTIATSAGAEGVAKCLAEADEITAGQVWLFGGEPVPLKLVPPTPLHHWTAYENGEARLGVEDIKDIWEPCRFGWAFPLGRAYQHSQDERYPEAFWRFAETFLDANPPELGPNWASGQEVAIRMLALVFAAQVFAGSEAQTPARRKRLAQAIADHASRIPATLVYARAQNNNHLLSESAGLITAGLALRSHPQAAGWRATGWRWFYRALLEQFTPEGAYCQHSANYHRLALQLMLWVNHLQRVDLRNELTPTTPAAPAGVRQRRRNAVRWLLSLVEAENGRTPNLGPNDGAYLFPLAAGEYDDFRPVLQAASWAFLGKPAFPAGPWDEMTDWFLPGNAATAPAPGKANLAAKGLPLTLHSKNSWVYLRAAHFSSRPGHADQLHLDLWWRGYNLAADPGTYRYNSPPPWDNPLTQAAVHNTITVHHQDQMLRVGPFLYLDWAQGTAIQEEAAQTNPSPRISASHDGYRRLGVTHQRTVMLVAEDQWRIEDRLSPGAAPYRLHWMLPDWPWQLQDTCLTITTPYGMLSLDVFLFPQDRSGLQVQLVRAGELLQGSGTVEVYRGWQSPTYGVKVPALSFSIEVLNSSGAPLISEWRLPR